MGTDIHMMFETMDDKGQWHPYGVIEETEEYDGRKLVYYRQDEIETWRNYRAFGILADVRNGVGFAGVDLGDAVIPISEPRGFPLDLSDELSDWADGADHTPSYLTLRDLVEYPYWESTVLNRCQMSLDEYEKFLGGDKKVMMCGACSGRNIEHVTEEEAKLLIENPERKIPGKIYYVSVEYPTVIKDEAGDYYSELIPYMESIAPEGSIDRVRTVFYFDS